MEANQAAHTVAMGDSQQHLNASRASKYVQSKSKLTLHLQRFVLIPISLRQSLVAELALGLLQKLTTVAISNRHSANYAKRPILKSVLQSERRLAAGPPVVLARCSSEIRRLPSAKHQPERRARIRFYV